MAGSRLGWADLPGKDFSEVRQAIFGCGVFIHDAIEP
jgi:hypothetical protein